MTIRDIAISFGYEIDKTSEKKANDSIHALKSTATKVLGALTVGFSIAGLSRLAEAAADLAALKSQFAQVFGEMEKQANDSMREVADDAGMMAGRLRWSFSQIAAFAKTAGMNTEDALGMTARAMRAATDSAAYYDRSVEDVTQTLQSFLKGNFANDAALGLSATETTRNAAANALYGKSFKDLAEDQKQLTLLKMVEDANALSGALGQASRESDTWSNQLGNLKQALVELKAGVGGVFLQSAIQVLKLLTDIVVELTAAINTLNEEGRILNRTFARITNGIKKAQVIIERLVNRLGGAEKTLKLLTIIAGAFVAVLAAKKIMAVVTAFKAMDKTLLASKMKMLAIIAVIVILALLIEDFTNFMSGNDSLMGEMFEKFGIDGEKVRETIRGILDAAKALIPFILDLAKQFGGMMVTALKQLLPLLMQLIKKLMPPLLAFIKKLAGLLMDTGSKIIPLIFGAIEKILPLLMSVIEKILPVIIRLVESLLPFLIQLVEMVLPVILSLIETLLPILFQIIEAILPAVIRFIDTLLPLVFQFIDTILPLMISLIETILPLVLQIIDTVLPIIIELLEQVLPTLVEIITAILPVILSLIEALLPLVFQIIEAILPVILELITAILPILTPIIELVASLVSSLLPPILSLLDAIVPTLKPILDTLEPIADILGDIIGTIAKVIGWAAEGFTWVVDVFTGGGKGIDMPTDSKGIPVKGHAKGTNRTADTFIAGEDGPELVTGAKGRKVFTHAATGNIFQTLKDIATMGHAPKPQTVAATTSSVESKSITQNIEITNQFNGDRAGQQKSAEAMNKAADDTTGFMARGLAYVR